MTDTYYSVIKYTFLYSLTIEIIWIKFDFIHHICYLIIITRKDSVAKNYQLQKQQENRRKKSRKRVIKVPYTPRTVNKNLKRTNQADKNRGRRKLRQSKTPATITALKNILVIKNDDKENQNLSEVSKNISFLSPNPKKNTTRRF